jgi:hypothetical protein
MCDDVQDVDEEDVGHRGQVGDVHVCAAPSVVCGGASTSSILQMRWLLRRRMSMSGTTCVFLPSTPHV